jgi:hypothetical protein
MTVPHPIQNLKSIYSRQKFGEKNEYGAIEYAEFEYGYWNPASGIYRVRHYNGKKYKERMDFFVQPITHTIPQDANRTKFKNCQLAWQALSDLEKEVYNLRARGRHMFGNNLFIREQMLL